MSELNYKVLSRGRIRTKVTKLTDKIQSNLVLLSESDKLSAISNLEQWKHELKQLDSDIGSLKYGDKSTAESLESEWEACESYESKITDTLTILKIPRTLPDRSAVFIEDSSTLLKNKLKLPEIPLPTYSNLKDETLNQFLSNFESIINKYSLSEYEKFVFLKRQLNAEPLTLINSLTGSDQSYAKAVVLLREAFADLTTQQYGVVRRLSELSNYSNSDPYSFISEIRQIQDLFTNLNITSELVMQYSFWNAMSPNLQTELVHLCNSNKPSLKAINDNIFKAVDRCKEMAHRESVRPRGVQIPEIPLNSFAANVKGHTKIDTKPVSKSSCSLCLNDKGIRDNTHSTKDCNKFKTAAEKVERLKTVNACTKCGYANHQSENCKFKFIKKCFKCNKDHMTYLCNHSMSDNSVTKSKPKTVNSGVILTSNAYQVDVGENAILPTFKCRIGDRTIRCMKDTGCQPHFILESLADDLKLPVINDNVSIIVNGFNEGREYLTKVVAVTLTISNIQFHIHAICMPSIKTKISLPGLSNVARVFEVRGYRLADGSLAEVDEISGLDFILGVSNPEVLLERQVSFGGSEPSVFSDTLAGVMLSGSLERFKRNLRNLPAISRQRPGKSSTNCEIHPVIDNDKTVSKPINVNHIIATSKKKINEKLVQKALDEALQEQCNRSLGYDTQIYQEETTEVDEKIIDDVLSKTERQEDGRLIMPLTWRNDAAKNLGKNLKLSEMILRSFKKFPTEKLILMNESIKTWENDHIIEKVPNLPDFLQKHPAHSFLPHMGVFKPDRETTKCRIVFLSNLCGKDEAGGITVSHNQAIHPGPNLNQKITTSLIHLRFDAHLLCFDLKKAFLQIALNDEDSNRLLFLWFRDVEKDDFTIQAFRSLRLPFGIRCSPTLLMLAMYRILCLDVSRNSPEEKEIKKRLYAFMYMDNGAYTGNSEQVGLVYNKLNEIFNPYKFEVQQLATSVTSLQQTIDSNLESETPGTVKLLGLKWNRFTDQLSNRQIELDPNANTKRLVLQSIASQYDPFNIQGPCLNRARLFLHSLQTDKTIEWDTVLETNKLKLWRDIVKQANKVNSPEISRSMGDRGDPYELIVFTDASKQIYGAVCYLRNMKTNKVSFLTAKNRLVNKQLELKTVPTLELQAVTLGVEMVADLQLELSGPNCVIPLEIRKRSLYTDSSIVIHWLQSQAVNYDKMQKKSVFVRNRLEYIERQCLKNSVSFGFVATEQNPADCITRCLSPTMLKRSCYHCGPSFLTDMNYVPDLSVDIPRPEPKKVESCHLSVAPVEIENLINLENFSSLKKPIRILANVLKFVGKLKYKLGIDKSTPGASYEAEAWKILLRREQRKQFPELLTYLENPKVPKKSIPLPMNRLNLFLDDGMVKLKSKFGRWLEYPKFCFPIYLDSKSYIVKLLVIEYHVKFSHAGCYTILAELKKRFWFDKAFSTVKQILKTCQTCKRFNTRKVKLNQSSYRDFRTNPSQIPFQHIFMDYLGPFRVGVGDERRKMWLLLVTCLWSRAVQLYVCPDMTVRSFLVAFQTQILREGLPSRVISDLGSQLVAGSGRIREFIESEDVKDFLRENGIAQFKFEHYAKGNSKLGSLVESCVKLVKRLIFGAIHNNVLEFHDFNFLIEQTSHIVNKRPIAFKEALRDDVDNHLPAVITPELLSRGRDLIALNVVPELASESNEADPDWTPRTEQDSLRGQLGKLNNSRLRLAAVYQDQLNSHLLDQATNVDKRYLPVSHSQVKVGDIVLVADPLLKLNNFPLARVTAVRTNALGETTTVQLTKGNSKEILQRHVSSIIPYFRPDPGEFNSSTSEAEFVNKNTVASRPKRKAAMESRLKTSKIFS